MKILKKSIKQRKVVVVVQNLDDLWHLSQIIEPGDIVKGKATRKIKATEKEASKKTFTLSIRVEGIDFKERSLRLNGVTLDEMQDIPRGSHQTISVEEGFVLGITKDLWTGYNLKRLEQATKRQGSVLIVILDREESIFALLKSQGYDVLAQVKGKVAKKGVETVTDNFYKDLESKLREYEKRLNLDSIIIASPAFWKEEFMKDFSSEEIKKKIVLATCSSVSKNAIEEVIKRPELKEVLRQQRAAEESKFIEELMVEIGKDGLAFYGRAEVRDAIDSGNTRKLLITDAFIYKDRDEAERLMKNAEAVKGEVAIINSENEAGKKLDALGGIAVLARYAIS